MLRLGRKPVQMLNRKISARIPHPSALWADAYELWYDCPGNHRFFGFAAGRTTPGEGFLTGLAYKTRKPRAGDFSQSPVGCIMGLGIS